MVRGLRVVFSPNPVSGTRYSYRVPIAGAHGTVTAVRTDGGVRTYLHGPSGGLVYVRWDKFGTVGVSSYDLDYVKGR